MKLDLGGGKKTERLGEKRRQQGYNKQDIRHSEGVGGVMGGLSTQTCTTAFKKKKKKNE